MDEEEVPYSLEELTAGINLIVRSLYDVLPKTKQVAVRRKIDKYIFERRILPSDLSPEKVADIAYLFLDLRRNSKTKI